MKTRPRRIRIRSSKNYVVFRLEDEITAEELRQASRRMPIRPPRPQLLALAMRTNGPSDVIEEELEVA